MCAGMRTAAEGLAWDARPSTSAAGLRFCFFLPSLPLFIRLELEDTASLSSLSGVLVHHSDSEDDIRCIDGYDIPIRVLVPLVLIRVNHDRLLWVSSSSHGSASQALDAPFAYGASRPLFD